MSLRKIRFWVRILPRTTKRKKTLVVGKPHSSGKSCRAALRKGEEAVSVEGFYWQEDGLVLNKEGKWVKP